MSRSYFYTRQCPCLLLCFSSRQDLLFLGISSLQASLPKEVLFLLNLSEIDLQIALLLIEVTVSRIVVLEFGILVQFRLIERLENFAISDVQHLGPARHRLEVI